MKHNKKEEKHVRKAADQFYKALNAVFTGDVEPMKAAWAHTKEVTYLDPRGEFLVGWEQVLSSWEAQAALKLGGSVEATNMKINTDGILAIVQNYVKGENQGQDGETVEVSIRATCIFQKKKDEWKVIALHTDKLSNLDK